MRNTTFLQSYFYFMILAIISCSSPKERAVVDVSHIPLDSIKIQRFDQSFGRLTSENAATLHREWKKSYGPFYSDFIEKILKAGPVDDDTYIAHMLGQIAALPAFQALRDTVAQTFPDLAPQEALLTDAFRRVRYYWPDAELPKQFIAFYSGFAVQVPIGESYIGLGLDLFLGSDSPFYEELINTFPRYLSKRFTPQDIPPRILDAYIQEYLLKEAPPRQTFLDHMLHEGRRLFLMDQLLPHTADSLKIGYTARQQAWAKHFQKAVWQSFVDEELLYQTDPETIRQYFGEAPFTLGMGDRNESAPKLGMYTGWQMVRSYMNLHPETTLDELIAYRNAQDFLAASGYQGDYQILYNLTESPILGR